MRTLKTRIQRHASSRKTQLILFGGLVTLTLLVVGLQVRAGQPGPAKTGSAHLVPPPGGAPPAATDITVHAALSQTKLVQGQDGMMYLQLSIHTPEELGRHTHQTPTDMVVVLDRSPSMLTANKLPFAKAAVLQLLNKLGRSDRLGLIAFDGRASVLSELVEVTPDARARLTDLITHLRVGSATNIGDGLGRARSLFEQSSSHRVKKVMLLSDGETNTGITDPEALARLVSAMSAKQIVVSTIGMGLGFNEVLMASLADHGMGHYSYLEHLHTLDGILAKDLEDARRLYAESSEIRLQLHPGVVLTDAAGYPIETVGGMPSHVRIKTGQLLLGTHKKLMLTLKPSTTQTGNFAVGEMAFRFSKNGAEHVATVKHDQLAFAVIEAARKPEAVASISRDVYRKSWLSNNLGRMRQQFQHWVKEGKKAEAKAAIANYRTKLQDAEAQSGLALSTKELEADITHMEDTLEETFRGTPAEQSVKRSRAAKSMQYQGRAEQRK